MKTIINGTTKMKNNFFILIQLALLSSCATSLSKNGEYVRVTNQSDDVKNCRFLKQVSSTSSWGGFAATGVGFESAMNQLKNSVAEAKGNVLLTQVLSNTMGGTNMIGDAYLCPRNNVSTKNSSQQAITPQEKRINSDEIIFLKKMFAEGKINKSQYDNLTSGSIDPEANALDASIREQSDKDDEEFQKQFNFE